MQMLITGGMGFIGAALARHLLDAGHRVRIFDDASRGDPRRLADLAHRIDFVRGDIRNAEEVLNSSNGCNMIWHLAAVNGTQNFYEAPDRVIDVGIRGTVNVVQAACSNQVQRLVFVSSSEVYGDALQIPTPETHSLTIPDPTNPRFSYAGSKIAGELLCLHLGPARGLETVIVRPHNIYGPDMGMDHVIPQLIEKMITAAEGKEDQEVEISIEGTGSETRAFCYIDDCVRGLSLAGMEGDSSAIYHLGTENEIDINHLSQLIANALDLRVTAQPSDRRPGSPMRRCPATEKLRLLGFEARISLSEGLAKTVSWHKKQHR